MIKIEAANRIQAAEAKYADAKAFIQKVAGIKPVALLESSNGLMRVAINSSDVTIAIRNLTTHYGKPKTGIHGMTKAHWTKWSIDDTKTLAVADVGARAATKDKQRGGKGFQYYIVLIDAAARFS